MMRARQDVAEWLYCQCQAHVTWYAVSCFLGARDGLLAAARLRLVLLMPHNLPIDAQGRQHKFASERANSVDCVADVLATLRAISQSILLLVGKATLSHTSSSAVRGADFASRCPVEACRFFEQGSIRLSSNRGRR